MAKTRDEIVAQGEAGDTEGAAREAELLVEETMEETLKIIENDLAVRDAGVEAFKSDVDRFVTLTLQMTMMSDLLAMTVQVDPKAIGALKGFTQMIFLLGYVAGRKGLVDELQKPATGSDINAGSGY